MSVHRVRAGGVQLAVREAGAANTPPMVLLHALGERAASWAPVTERFAERFHVFAFDLRGHGDSDWPGEYSFRLMREDVHAALAALDLGPVTVAGHSMGGTVALNLAMHDPTQVHRLVVEDAAPPFRRERAVPERPSEPLDFDWAAVPAIVGEVNAGDHQAWQQLNTISAPTLIIGGGPTSSVPQDLLARAARLIPRCTLVTIDAGHRVHATRPGEFADAVLGWLERVPVDGAAD